MTSRKSREPSASRPSSISDREPSREKSGGVPARAYLALGSNLGDRAAHLAFAREELRLLPETRIIGASQVEETAPLGGRRQPAYLNQMVLLETTLTPRQLLQACRAIEHAAGRERRERWSSRTLDIDIVRYGNLRVSEPDLTIPHPGLGDREFWQRELEELKQYERG